MSVTQDGARRARILDPAAIERKLALNTYNVDRSRAHIRIIDHEVCLQCERQQCVNCCPANCYTPQEDGRTSMTVRFPSGPMPITLDTAWSNHAADELAVDSQVMLEGRLTRINVSSDPDWNIGTMRIDGFGYPVTLLLADIEKA